MKFFDKILKNKNLNFHENLKMKKLLNNTKNYLHA